MFLIIGLGNPGAEYHNTRHNLGRETALALQKESGFHDFRFEKKWNAGVSEGKIGREKVILLLPDTFMNKSGSAIISAARFFKIKPENILVIHDDADLELGRAKMSFGKHSAGHKGVDSIIRALHTREFWRFRLGIAGRRNIPAEKLVLKKFTPEEKRAVNKIIKHTVAALKTSVTQGPEKAMNEYNS